MYYKDAGDQGINLHIGVRNGAKNSRMDQVKFVEDSL